MTSAAPATTPSAPLEGTNPWPPVWSMAACVAGLIIAEFLPAGLLTPMAQEFNISEGTAGQTVTFTSIFAFVTSLGVAYPTRNANRRTVMLALSFLLPISCLLVAWAPQFAVLLLGRMLLGVSLGGFWSMTTAVAIRLVPEHQVPKALSIIFGSSSLAAVLAAPLGSYLGTLMGWRQVFLVAAGLGAGAFVLQLATLPSLRPQGQVSAKTSWQVLTLPGFAAGLLAVMGVFGARFCSFTYLRPWLEQTHFFTLAGLSAAFFVFDFGNFLGNLAAPKVLRQHLIAALWASPLALAGMALALMALSNSYENVMVMLFMWGACFGAIPSGWSMWVAQAAPKQAETAGGLYVAAVQLSAAVGAMAGGALFDRWGAQAVLLFSAVLWLASAGTVLLRLRQRPR